MGRKTIRGNSSVTFSGVNINANTNTDSIEILDAARVGAQVISKTGNLTTAVTTIQHSFDRTNWVPLAVINQGNTLTSVTTMARWVRARITTVEGTAATADIIFGLKP